jgi:hypothetical protein
MYSTALTLALGGGAFGTGLAATRMGGLRDAFRLAPAIAASTLLAYLFGGLIFPVLPAIWAAGHYNEAIGGGVAALLPALVGALVDPDAPVYQQAREIAWVGCIFVGLCFIGYPFFINLIGAA